MTNFPFTIKPIVLDSEEYRKELEIRNLVLRKPLGLNLFDEDLSDEVKDYHLGVFSVNELVGTLVLTPKGEVVKMRQVAIVESVRGMNAGKAVVLYSERFAKEKGFLKMELHARKTAVSFYLKLGYKIVGEEFEEVTIPHFKMSKAL